MDVEKLREAALRSRGALTSGVDDALAASCAVRCLLDGILAATESEGDKSGPSTVIEYQQHGPFMLVGEKPRVVEVTEEMLRAVHDATTDEIRRPGGYYDVPDLIAGMVPRLNAELRRAAGEGA